MTDSNATELLRKILDERGVSHVDHGCNTAWTVDGESYSALERNNGSLSVAPLTPEQAIAATPSKPNATSNQESIVRSFLRKISPNRDWDYLGEHEHAMIADLVDAIAATLGRPKAKSHPYGYERDTGCYDCTRCECGCINDISAAYCNDCGGEIEIDESAEKEYYDGCRRTVFAVKHDDGSLELCERRYVPEDAATLGSTLTAEQVRKVLLLHLPHREYYSVEQTDAWQAIADELNEWLRGKAVS